MTPELQPFIELKQSRNNSQLEIQVFYTADSASEQLIGQKDLKVNIKLHDARNITSSSYSIPVFFYNYQPPKFAELSQNEAGAKINIQYDQETTLISPPVAEGTLEPAWVEFSMSAELNPMIELKQDRNVRSLYVHVKYSHDLASERLINNPDLHITLTLWDGKNMTNT